MPLPSGLVLPSLLRTSFCFLILGLCRLLLHFLFLFRERPFELETQFDHTTMIVGSSGPS